MSDEPGQATPFAAQPRSAMIASATVTAEVLEAYVRCPHKAHLLLTGHTGKKPDYEIAAAELRNELRRKAIEKIAAHHRNIQRNGGALKCADRGNGAAVILDAVLEVDGFAVRVDGLRKAVGESHMG